ncbi:MAG: hypothetical protein NC092_02465 [Butyrivibrio sp.]|nr:hypothetical protein [Muribaculum sp.]MCM1551536.1 hypothetical protein [Butyrivibrio sp.]
MTSKNSTHKISFWELLRDDMRRRVWMIAISTLVSFVSLPVEFLFSCGRLSSNRLPMTASDIDPAAAASLAHDSWERLSDYLIADHAIIQIACLIPIAILVAIYGFRHLYSRKMADLYHSMPVSRDKSFLVY